MKTTGWFILCIAWFLVAGCGQKTPLVPEEDQVPASTVTLLPATVTPKSTSTLVPSPTAKPTQWADTGFNGKGWQLTVDFDGIRLYDLDTADRQNFSSRDGSLYPPCWAWSPDGNWIIYNDFQASGSDLDKPHQHWIANLVTGEKFKLPRYSFAEPFPNDCLLRWHPENKAILLEGLLIRPEDGSIISRIDEGGVLRGSWDADGKRLAFLTVDGMINFGEVQLDATEKITGVLLKKRNCEPRGDTLVCGVTERLSDPIVDVQWSPASPMLGVFTRQDIFIYNWEEDRLVNLTQGLWQQDNRVPGGYALTWAPDGKKIAFYTYESTDNGLMNPRIFLVNLDEMGVTEITGGEFPYGVAPAWSPDGEWIFYSAVSQEDPGQIVARNLTGFVWVSLPSEMHGYALAFRPGRAASSSGTQSDTSSQNRNRIAFVSDRDSTPNAQGMVSTDIYVMNSDGSGVTRLTNTPEQEGPLAWSPDGKKITYASGSSLYVMNIDGSGVTRLTGQGVDGSEPDWSPDGKKIAFTSYRDGNWEIYVMNADGSGVTRLTNHLGDDLCASWSPDGEKIAFQANRDGEGNRIYLMNSDGTNVARLSNEHITGCPQWSPDGTKIAAVDIISNNNSAVLVMNADGSDLIRLISNAVWTDPSLTWSPDGSRLAFTSDLDGNYDIYVMNADGSVVTNLTNHPAHDWLPAWSPVGNASASIPCSPSWSRLAIGQYATVTDENAAANRVRSEPVIGDNVIAKLGPGMVSKILEGPVCVDEYVFWKVENPTIPGGVGWTSEGDGKSYWLAPYGSAANAASLTPKASPTVARSGVVTNAPAIFFTVGGNLYAMDLDGQNVRLVQPGLDIANSMTGDLGSSKLYFNHWNMGAQVKSLALGSSPSLHNFADGPGDGGQGLAIDTYAGRLFQGLYYNGVYAMDLSTLSWKQIVRPEQLSPLLGQRGQLQLDIGRSKIYFRTSYNGDCGQCRMIYRVNYDGSDLKALVPANGGDALAVDTARGILYYSDAPEPNTIRMANLDGTNVKTLLTLSDPYNFCRSIAFNWDGYLYLSLLNSNGYRERAIARVRLDGSNFELLYEMKGVSEADTDGALFFWPGTTGSKYATATPTPKPTSTAKLIATPTPKPTETARLTASPTPSRPVNWTRLNVSFPTAWRGMTAAYDTNRKVVVLFGGTGEMGKPLDETWEFDGQSWKKISSEHKPPPRFWHGMAYDASRGKVVLYGGWIDDNGNALNDTWEYDGKDWTNIATNGPSARGYGPAMTYDSCRKKVVLFGGAANGKYFNDTWEYDGRSWTSVGTQNLPSKRALTSIAFDSKRCVAVLFAGFDNGLGYSDTWEFDGVNWNRVISSGVPPARWGHALVYDPVSEQVLLFGGYSPETGKQTSDTWVYAAKNWKEIKPTRVPAAREQHVLVFDGSQVLLYGGFGFRETWQIKP